MVNLGRLLSVTLVGVVIACGGSPTSSADVGQGSLTGAGATFPEPFYSKAFYIYIQSNPQVTVNYQAAGGPTTLVQIPATLGVVALAYNLPSVTRLQLDGASLAGIYFGQIKRWK